MTKKYIDADVLIDLLYEFEPENWTNSDKELQAVNDFELFRSLIKAEPAADVKEVRHAYWVKAPCSEWDGDANCSCCGNWDWSDKKYCSSCGAKMELEKKCN